MGDLTPKHKIVKEWLGEKLANGEYPAGEKIPSENELAVKFGFSRQTVRQAILSLEAGGLVKRVRGSGTYAAYSNSIQKEKTGTIGVVITYLDDYVFPSIVQGIEGVLSKSNYSMSFGITYNRLENEAKALKQMLLGVDGIIIEGTKSAFPNPNSGIFKLLKKNKIPYLFINGYYEDIGNGYVIIDDKKAGRLACEHLITMGHTRLGGIFKSDDMQGHKRFEGFSETMAEQNLPLHDRNLIWYTTEDVEYFFSGECDNMILDRLKDCTGAFCYNDLIAAKLIDLLKRNDISVPDEFSVISIDNSSLSAPSLYNLTTLVYPAYEVGKAAAENLLKIVENPNFQAGCKLDTELIIRGSVKNKN